MYKGLSNYIEGTILGSAIGDALGMPFEGLTKEQIQTLRVDVTKYNDANFQNRANGLKKGQYTDDTQLSLATIESTLENNGKVNISDMGRRFANLYKEGKLRCAGRSTQRALKNISKGMSYLESGIEDAYGCGAAMRIAPIALLEYEGREAESLIAKCSYITHKNSVALASSMAVAYSIKFLLGGKQKLDSTEDKQKFLGIVKHWTDYNTPTGFDFKKQLELARENIKQTPEELAKLIGTGGVATESVIYAITAFLKEPHNFKELMNISISNGGDTDSIASISGSLYGAYNGKSKINKEYIINVEDSQKIQKLAQSYSKLISN